MTRFPADMHLRRGGTSVVIRVDADTVPHVLYWGSDLGELSEGALAQFAVSQVPAVTSGTADVPPSLGLVPSQADGWLGTPGLAGSRAGRAQFSAFRPVAVIPELNAGGTLTAVTIECDDAEATLRLSLVVELTESGMLRTRAILRNDGDDGYSLGSLLLALPTPAAESRVIDLTGRHLRERDIQTHEFTIGAHVRAIRVARGHAVSAIHGTCEETSGWRSGMVHYVHVAWSGNTTTIAERDTFGFQGLLGGEILLPGEVTLANGESYESPWIIGTWGNGLDEAAARIHDFVRSRKAHPHSVRPVTLNAWEAVYFDHSLPRLLALVDAAAETGVERFVLDDGWFGSRRDDTSGLGDWVVSPDVWPNGLSPLADAIHEKGMQFGLWVEPEAINPDSDVARAHPEWILSPATHRPREARWQQVMDLTNPEAFDHVLSQLLRVLADVEVDYLKWDYNRDLYESISPRTGLPAYHAQTKATYALMEALLQAHPGIEIESCAGGGGRIDLAVMERCVRVWGSDCIDPLERKLIEAGTALLLPPELVGSHIASTTSHTTGRTLNLTLRASTAMFSHMGIEWDLTEAAPEERRELAAWVALHKELRPMLHSGRVVHTDHPDDSWWVNGVVDQDQSHAVYALTRMRTAAVRPTPPLRLTGLRDDLTYFVRELLPDGVTTATAGTRPDQEVPWWTEGLTLPGSVLAQAGIRIPDLMPERAILLEVTAI